MFHLFSITSNNLFWLPKNLYIGFLLILFYFSLFLINEIYYCIKLNLECFRNDLKNWMLFYDLIGSHQTLCLTSPLQNKIPHGTWTGKSLGTKGLPMTLLRPDPRAQCLFIRVSSGRSCLDSSRSKPLFFNGVRKR